MSLAKTFGRASFLVPRAVEKTAVRGHKHFQSSLPLEKVSKAEEFVLKSLISVGVMAYPMWVLFHLKEYKVLGRYEEDRF